MISPPAPTRVYETFDLALRVGEVLLASGSSAADAAATMARVLQAYGVTGANVDVTFTSLTISYQHSPESPPETQMRVVQYRSQDFSRLTATTLLVHRIGDGLLSVPDARSELEAIVGAAHPYRQRLAVLAWGVVAASVAVLLGAGWWVIGSAFASAATVYAVNRVLARLRIPMFFQQMTGAFIATMFAVALYATGLPAKPSLVLVSGIVILLAGMTFVGAVEDALTGYFITAAARLLEVGVLTGGLIAGVSLGLGVARRVGVSFAAIERRFGLYEVPLLLAAAGACAAAAAYAAYAPKRALLPAAVSGAAGEGVFLLAREAGFAAAWSAGAAAVVVGVAAFTFAGRMRLPALVLTSSGVVPLLPGLSIYTGLFLVTEGASVPGIEKLAAALTTGAALAAGVMLGARLAEPVKLGGRHLEVRLRTRLAGSRAGRPRRLP